MVLGLVEEGEEAGGAQESVHADDDGARSVVADDGVVPEQVGQIGGQQTEHVQLARQTLEIVLPQLDRIGHHQSLFQVTCNVRNFFFLP